MVRRRGGLAGPVLILVGVGLLIWAAVLVHLALGLAIAGVLIGGAGLFYDDGEV